MRVRSEVELDPFFDKKGLTVFQKFFPDFGPSLQLVSKYDWMAFLLKLVQRFLWTLYASHVCGERNARYFLYSLLRFQIAFLYVEFIHGVSVALHVFVFRGAWQSHKDLKLSLNSFQPDLGFELVLQCSIPKWRWQSGKPIYNTHGRALWSHSLCDRPIMSHRSCTEQPSTWQTPYVPPFMWHISYELPPIRQAQSEVPDTCMYTPHMYHESS